MQLRCGNCGHYLNPKVVRNYPNCKDGGSGWVTCRVGCTVKELSMPCADHTLKPRPAKRALVHKKARRVLL